MGEADQPSVLVAGRYRLEGRLGRGGMADVCLAHDTVLDRRVAVKLLRQGPETDRTRARFDTEARLLAGLSHPGLVTVLDAGISGDQPYLVMELLPGGTVADLVERGAQPLDAVARIGAEVGSALVPVHAAGVVHRDIKPGNLLLDEHGNVRLADFGIARLVGETVRVTATGTTVGTVTYLAPEQAEGGAVGPAADVYSLGLVLLELVTGVPAFAGTGVESALARLTRDPQVPDHLPDALGRLLTEMTARAPGDRPTAAQAGQRLAALSRVLAEARAGQAGIDTLADDVVAPAAGSVGAWWHRRFARVGALAGAALAVAVGAGVTLAGDTSADARAVRWQAPVADASAAVVKAGSGVVREPVRTAEPGPGKSHHVKHGTQHRPKKHKSEHRGPEHRPHKPGKAHGPRHR